MTGDNMILDAEDKLDDREHLFLRTS